MKITKVEAIPLFAAFADAFAAMSRLSCRCRPSACATTRYCPVESRSNQRNSIRFPTVATDLSCFRLYCVYVVTRPKEGTPMIRFGLLIATVWVASLCSVTYAQDRGFASAIEWSPDGETIAVASSTGVWFFDTGLQRIGACQGQALCWKLAKISELECCRRFARGWISKWLPKIVLFKSLTSASLR